ncbi:hypothetical protein A9Q91_05000 [Candidatus Gracilibacteria bacterium 28_42_T64]|nr:hypothetical protein A9Q91_05000 [Candidatus Gracilibacteria bacterium 28_42_T64]
MGKYIKETSINFGLINFIPLLASISTILFEKGYKNHDILFVYKTYLGGLLGNLFLPIPFSIQDTIFYIIILFIFNFILVFIYTKIMINAKVNNIYMYTLILGILSSIFGFFFLNITA